MGAWGVNAFENDGARDWLWELEGSAGVSAVRRALDTAMEEDYLVDDMDAIAIAASEVIAMALGAPDPKTLDEEEIVAFVEEYGEAIAPYGEDALAAIRKVQSSSELADLWEDSGNEEWLLATNDLALRLETSI